MSGYIGQAPVVQATQTRQSFTATANQTSFSTLGYQENHLDVFLNGVKLNAADYTATNNSDIVLAAGCAVNDILEMVAFGTFEVANQSFTGTTVINTLTVTNDGTGSNLDADLLDGQHGAYYTGYTDTQLAALVDSSPAALNTLNELAAALGDDANFSTTVTNSIATKLPLAGGTMTGDITRGGTVIQDGTITDTGDFTLDVAGDIILDADAANWRFKDAGTSILEIGAGGGGGGPSLFSAISDADMVFKGNDSDGGGAFTALTLDMSDAGTAKFNNKIVTGLGSGYATDADITLGSGAPAIFFHDTSSGENNASIEVNNGAMLFRNGGTGTNVSNLTERVRISNAGNVGISNTSPAEKLHIQGTNPRIYVDGDSNSYYPSIRVRGVNGGISMGTYHGGNISGTTLTFLTGSNETDSGTAHMKINSAGHITTQYGDTSGYSQTSGSGGFAYVNDVGTAAGTGIFANNATRGWSNLYLNKFQWSSGQDTRFIQFTVNGSGAAGYINIASASTITYTTSSDYRLKENVVYDWDATTRLKQLKPARFNFILDGTDTPQDGFMAHEAQEVVPLSVSGTKDAMKDEEYEITPAVLDDDGVETEAAVMGTRSVIDPQSIDHSMLVPLLVKTIQELEARITALEDV